MAIIIKKGVNEEAEERKVLQAKKKKRKRSKEEVRDTWTVIAILATVMLVAIAISLFKSNIINPEKYSGMTNKEKQEAAEDARKITVSAGVICFGIVVVYVVKRSKNRKKNESVHPEYIDHDRVEAARRRVARAKEMAEIEQQMDMYSKGSRGRKERLGDSDSKSRDRELYEDKKSFEDMDLDEREAYLERRQKAYKYYMENGEDESRDVESYFDLLEDESENSNLSTFIKNNKRMLIVAGAVGLAVVAAIVLSIIL